MNKHEMKKERVRIMAEISRLNHRADSGEDVQAELLSCGKELSNIGKDKLRVDVMDMDNLKGDYRITKEMKRRAMGNGISYSTLQNRIYTLQWDNERAVTEVPTRKVSHAERGLTVENYKHLRNEGFSDLEIRNKYGITNHSMSKFKSRNGLTKKRVMA